MIRVALALLIAASAVGAAGAAGAAIGAGTGSAAPTLAVRAVDRLEWMAGCWVQSSPRMVIEEQWTSPRGGIMLGTSRTIRRTEGGERAVAYEFVRIYRRGDSLVFAAQPSGQAPAEFAADSLGNRHVSFANPAHDFPQRISYRRVSDDSLHARIEGPGPGGTRSVDFRYGRCGG